MADTKISALTASTTPLAGTEVLPIVQSGVTKQVSVANLTTGRAISATELTLTTGNLIIGTSGKGIDFSATPGTGTSELLSDYEEGTWTPVATGVTVNSGTPVWSGIYTKVGRTVVATWRLTGGANVSIAVGNRLTLPFTSSDIAWGSYGNNSSSAFIGGLQTVGADVYFGTASTVAAAGGTIVFQV
jgi:hypothetical protein